MKKRILATAIVLICFSILASGSLAFYTASDTARNVITSDGVDIRVEEWQRTLDGVIPYPTETPIEVMPGVTVSKIATVKNNDAVVYIRARFTVVVTQKDGTVIELEPQALNDIISVNVNEENWLRKDGDGQWWYYNDSVETGASTEAFFTEVVFDGPNMTNEYQNCKVEILVTAQAVQKANNGNNVMEAAGWPEA